MLIMKKWLIYILFYILIMFVYFNFIYDLKCRDLSDSFVVFYNILFYYIVSFPIIMVFLYYKKFYWPLIISCMFLHIIICLIVIEQININIIKERPSMIIPTKKGSQVYKKFSLECSRTVTLHSITEPASVRSQIHGFGFYEGKDFYNYHDYSLKKTDLVYYNVGFYVIYNAVFGLVDIQDSTIMLCFNDVRGKYHNVKYSVKGYPNIPDTFLIYRNINEKRDSVWHVCAPEVNTPENRAKISDYGYIFHYDVYSKQEIESQCPRIKEYVEQYKNRMSPPL